ncbi:MAG: hypothetical protein JWN67_4556, partial [Actinomycetia bacterium]|nr:hypothetical protein [Actinomycetes bacterium]
DHATVEGFIKPAHRGMLLVDEDATRLMVRLQDWTPPTVTKWVAPEDR